MAACAATARSLAAKHDALLDELESVTADEWRAFRALAVARGTNGAELVRELIRQTVAEQGQLLPPLSG